MEMDLNPLIVDENGAIAADARIVIDHAANASGDRYAHMAIYPYPVHLIQEWQMNDGKVVTIRPIRPEDAEHGAGVRQGACPTNRTTTASWTPCAN